MSKRRRNHNGLEGIPRVYIEERLLQFQEEQDWAAVIDMLGLLFYGMVLFPYVEDYVDLAAMEVVLAKRDRGENPTMAVLANTYYTLNYCSERKVENLRDRKPTGENTTGRSDTLGLTSSEKGSRGGLEAAGSPQATGPSLNNESTSWVSHGVVSSISTKEPELMKYRRHSRSRHSKAL
ncbi:hypothetical protein CR513_21747, partial [Mucuna pruriens]